MREHAPRRWRGALRTIAAEQERFVFVRELPGDVSGAAIVALARRPALPAEVQLPAGAPASFVDIVTGDHVDATGGKLIIPADAFGVHVFVAANGPCSGS